MSDEMCHVGTIFFSFPFHIIEMGKKQSMTNHINKMGIFSFGSSSSGYEI